MNKINQWLVGIIVVPYLGWISWVSMTLIDLKGKMEIIVFVNKDKISHQRNGGVMRFDLKEFYEKKYPGGRVDLREDSIDVFCEHGHHQVCLRKNGAGQWKDFSKAAGCKASHDLSEKKEEEA